MVNVRREPVVVSFIAAAVALAAMFGWNVPAEWAETAIDIGSGAIVLYSVVFARSRVTPV